MKTSMNHNTHKVLTAFALATASLLTAGTPALAAGEPAATLDQAHHAYYLGQFDRSLKLYEQLAASGNAEAAERAGFMLLQVNSDYGQQVRRDPARATALLVQAAKAGRAGAGAVLNLIDRIN